VIDALWAHVAWRHAINGADAQWRSGEPALAGALPTVASLQWQIVAVDDFNGDGRADLFWRNATDGRNVIWRRANATMVQRVASVPDLGWRVLGACLRACRPRGWWCLRPAGPVAPPHGLHPPNER